MLAGCQSAPSLSIANDSAIPIRVRCTPQTEISPNPPPAEYLLEAGELVRTDLPAPSSAELRGLLVAVSPQQAPSDTLGSTLELLGPPPYRVRVFTAGPTLRAQRTEADARPGNAAGVVGRPPPPAPGR